MILLQLIGFITVIYLGYKYLYMPLINQKEEKNKDYEDKVRILSFNYGEMINLFQLYAKRRTYNDDFGKEIAYGVEREIFGRHLTFSNEGEITIFKQQVDDLYKKLNDSPTSKVEIEDIYREAKERQNDYVKQKQIKDLAINKIFLEYDGLLKELMPTHEIALTKQEIVNFIVTKSNKSLNEVEHIFAAISDNETGILWQDINRKGWIDRYKYFGKTAVETRLKQIWK